MSTKVDVTAATVAAALAMVILPASAQQMGGEKAEKEKCYGIALKGQNDCASKGHNSCAGESKIDYDPGAWKYVAKGTCETIKTPAGTGSLTPKKS